MCNNKSSSLERRVQAYLKPKNDAIFTAFVKVENISESSAINMIVKDFFNRMPEQQKIDYLSKARAKREY